MKCCCMFSNGSSVSSQDVYQYYWTKYLLLEAFADVSDSMIGGMCLQLICVLSGLPLLVVAFSSVSDQSVCCWLLGFVFDYAVLPWDMNECWRFSVCGNNVRNSVLVDSHVLQVFEVTKWGPTALESHFQDAFSAISSEASVKSGGRHRIPANPLYSVFRLAIDCHDLAVSVSSGSRSLVGALQHFSYFRKQSEAKWF